MCWVARQSRQHLALLYSITHAPRRQPRPHEQCHTPGACNQSHRDDVHREAEGRLGVSMVPCPWCHEATDACSKHGSSKQNSSLLCSLPSATRHQHLGCSTHWRRRSLWGRCRPTTRRGRVAAWRLLRSIATPSWRILATASRRVLPSMCTPGGVLPSLSSARRVLAPAAAPPRAVLSSATMRPSGRVEA